MAAVSDTLRHVEGDIRDWRQFKTVWDETKPEVVFHLAAQAIVRRSYSAPLETVTTNTIGTTHVLELLRQSESPTAAVLITSDKCYENFEWARGYSEDDRLGGRDIYSASKAAAEVLISSYRRSFFGDGISAASARAGNVIGGGDWSPDRIVPDTVSALRDGRVVRVRNPAAVRPWQHVLEPLSGYLALANQLLSPNPTVRTRFASCWNFGPEIENTRTVGELVEALIARWGSGQWVDGSSDGQPHEAGLLRLNIDKAKTELGWRPRLGFESAVAFTVDWFLAYQSGRDMRQFCEQQIIDYEQAPLE